MLTVGAVTRTRSGALKAAQQFLLGTRLIEIDITPPESGKKFVISSYLLRMDFKASPLHTVSRG